VINVNGSQPKPRQIMTNADNYITKNHQLLRDEFAAELLASGFDFTHRERAILEAEMEADLRQIEESRHAA